jgi:ATP-dependent helicase HrpA
MPGEIESLLPHLPGMDAIRLEQAPWGAAAELERELVLLIADRAVVGEAPLPRTAAEFEARLNAGFPRLWDAGLLVADLAGRILRARADLERAMDRVIPAPWRPAVNDIREQMKELMPPRFLTTTPWGWLSRLPEQIAAAEARFRKLAHGGHVRDARLMAEIAPWRERHRAERVRQERAGTIDPALEHFGFMLQEWRIALFAQELGTSIPVSSKRLEKQWAEVGA